MLGYLFLDLLPWLQYLPEWFPGARFQTKAKESRTLTSIYRNELYSLTKKKLSEGTATECMTTIFLSETSFESGVVKDEKEFTDVAATVFLAGSDTTFTTLMCLFLALLKYPEVQRRAQKEIDRVVGSDRLPSFEDREQLPYIRAILSEVLRWKVIAPMAIPHYATQDDEYRGYHIPAGTIVIPNVWAIAGDRDTYPEPLEFIPERWLPDGSHVNSIRPEEFVFGYGRRICPGQVWAEHLLFICAASLLAAFNIERAMDVNGKLIPLNEQMKSDTVRSLGPSKCKITPRSPKIVALIREYSNSG